MNNFDTFFLTFSVLLSPSFAAEAQSNSLSSPAGPIYSNVSTARVQGDHSCLAAVK